MSLQAGTIVSLQVQREVSPYGYFLTDGRREVLLPYAETDRKFRAGGNVEVFLYHDSEDRLSATTKQPLIKLDELALLQVAEVHSRLGCFLEMGLGRHLLLPYQELPELPELRPRAGDSVYVTLGHDKQGRLLARWAGEKELLPLCFQAPGSWHNQWVDCRVYKPLQQGSFVICAGGVLGFGAIGLIHAEDRTRMLRLGEAVSARVIYVREDGRVNLSMRPLKETAREADAERLLQFLKDRPNGAMPYSDKTSADIISARFGLSKSAFKRAIGKLLKEGLIVQEENGTRLTDKAKTNGIEQDVSGAPQG